MLGDNTSAGSSLIHLESQDTPSGGWNHGNEKPELP